MDQASTGHHDLAEEIRRNRETRAANRARAERHAARVSSPLARWGKWALEPASAIAHSLRIARQHRTRPAKIRRYLAGHGFKGLHVGCGTFPLPGWQNTEYLYPRSIVYGLKPHERKIDFHLDITAPLPYPDGSLDAIFAEEVIEHVPLQGGAAFFAEARRVLRPGGVLRLTTPDAEGIARVYAGVAPDVRVEDFEPFWLNPHWSRDIWINGLFRYYGHQHVYGFHGLVQALREAGFDPVDRVALHETGSDLPELAGLERHGISNPEIRRINAEVRMIVEAFRP